MTTRSNGTADISSSVEAVMPRRFPALWNVITGVFGTIAGLAPHVMHHIGLLAGTAIVTGAGGTALFGGVGLVASIPLLRRLYRRFHTWQAPAIGVAVFLALFSLSAFVIGPAINSDKAGTPSPASTSTDPHQGHHG